MDPTQAVSEKREETTAVTPVGKALFEAEGGPVIPSHSQSCPTCAAAAAQAPPEAAASAPAKTSYIYAIGKIEPRFPKISVEKEFAQAVGREKTEGLTDRQTLHAVLSKAENRYLVRQLCWVMTIEGLETYIVVPRDPADSHLLVESLRAHPTPGDLDVVIGLRGPLAPPDMCNGLQVPVVIFDQIYSFDREALIKAIPRPEKIAEEDFSRAAEELFDRIMLMTDNAGATDENRALNYLAVRYNRIYEAVTQAFAQNESLTGVHVLRSPLSGTRNVVEVVFSFTHRSTDVVSKQGLRVDVTDEFPFLVTKLSPYYDR
jgi:hypothetical protein